MRFSLVLCTLDRTIEVEEFLTSLVTQTYQDFELIIVDQNKTRCILDIIEKFTHLLNIKHYFNEIGLSKSRNKGLIHALGEIVCFPDDDCIYPPSLLHNINNIFLHNDYDVLMGKTIDPYTDKIVAGKNISFSKKLTTFNLLGSSTTLFIKRSSFEIVFDERFGLGGLFNAEEENELVFRLLKSGYKGYYEPYLNYVYHPPSDLDFENYKRARLRTIGLGAFIAKHILTKEGIFYFIKYNLLRPFIGTVIYLLKLDFVKSKYYFNRFLGIWIGFIKYFRYKNENYL